MKNKYQIIWKNLENKKRKKEKAKTILGLICLIACLTLSGLDNAAITTANAGMKSSKTSNEAVVDGGNCDVKCRIKKVAEEEGFKDTDYLLKIAFCESSFRKDVRGDNGKARGLFQIHSDYWDVSDDDAFNVEFATKWAIQKIREGKQWIWTCNNLID